MTRPRPRGHHSGLGFGGQSQPAVTKLAETVLKPMGAQCDKVGVSPSLGDNQGSAVHSTSLFSPSSRFVCPSSFERGSGITSPETGNRRSDMPRIPGVLRTHFRSPESVGRMETGTGFIQLEYIPHKFTVPYGNAQLHQGLNPQDGLGGLYRPAGCIFSHTHPQEGPQISEVCMGRQSLPIPRPPFWSGPGPMAVLQDHTRISSPCTGKGHQAQDVFGRLAASGSQSPAMFGPAENCTQPVQTAGICSEPEKVGTNTISAFYLPGDGVRYGSMVRPSIPSAHSEAECKTCEFTVSRSNHSQEPGFVAGSSRIISTATGSRTPAQTGIPTRVSASIFPEEGTVVENNHSDPMVGKSDQTVDGSSMAERRGSPDTTSTRGSGVHGCLDSGLGRSLQHPDSVREVDCDSAGLAYKQIGVRSGCAVHGGVSPTSAGKNCSDKHGQHNGSLLHKQARGHPLSDTLSECGGTSTLVPETCYLSDSKVCTRKYEHSSGRSEQGPHGGQLRVDARKERSRTGVANLVQAANRPICNKVQQKTGNVRVSSSRSRSMGGGCAVDQVGQPNRLRISSTCINGKGTQKGKRGRGENDIDRPLLAVKTMVSRAEGSVTPRSSKATDKPRITDSAQIGHKTQRSRSVKSSRMDALRKSLRSRGASEATTDLITSGHRKSTRSVYAYHWIKWEQWCKHNSVNIITPSSMEFSNFLSYLSKEKGLSASSLRTHRAAISSTIQQLGGPSFSEDPLLRGVIRGASISQAKSPKRIPAWDLFLVLDYLKRPPFEPIREISIKHLTLKTVFLVTLASGRRGSEVHAFSGNPKSYAFEIDGSVSLQFLEDFVAKNQIPGTKSPVVNIKSLRDSLDSSADDRKICPVRALRQYMQRTEAFRLDRKRLFISFNLEYTKDIHVTSLARWLKTVIKKAYSQSSLQTDARAHEIRAWSASLALEHNVAINDILEAAYWRSRNVFIKHYLRRVAHLRGDGSHGISSVAVAQSIISSHH